MTSTKKKKIKSSAEADVVAVGGPDAWPKVDESKTQRKCEWKES